MPFQHLEQSARMEPDYFFKSGGWIEGSNAPKLHRKDFARILGDTPNTSSLLERKPSPRK